MPEKFESQSGELIEVGFKSPEKRKVTDRTYGQYLEQFFLDEKELEGKKILDIGAGLSAFSKTVNEELSKTGTIAIPMDPMYQFLGKNFEEFKKNITAANMDWHSSAGWRKEGRAYEDFEGTPNQVVGSHQELPFENESLDLVLANNSITQYKDRQITRRALEEALRVIKKDGEVRVLPADFMYDPKKGSSYVNTFEGPTPETAKEAEELGLEVAPDREMFQVLKDIEDQGVHIYAKVIPPKNRRPMGRMFRIVPRYSYTLFFRKDEQVPNVAEIEVIQKLSFRDSEDGFHFKSEEIKLPKKGLDSFEKRE